MHRPFETGLVLPSFGLRSRIGGFPPRNGPRTQHPHSIDLDWTVLTGESRHHPKRNSVEMATRFISKNPNRNPNCLDFWQNKKSDSHWKSQNRAIETSAAQTSCTRTLSQDATCWLRTPLRNFISLKNGPKPDKPSNLTSRIPLHRHLTMPSIIGRSCSPNGKRPGHWPSLRLNWETECQPLLELVDQTLKS